MLRVDMLENQLMDLRMRFAQLCYNPDFVSTPWGGHRGTDTPPPPPNPGSLVPCHTGDMGNQAMASMRRALGCTPCLAAVTPWVLRGGQPPPQLCPPPLPV